MNPPSVASVRVRPSPTCSLPKASRPHSRFRAVCCPTPSPARTCWQRRPPAPARRSPSASRWSSESTRTGPTPAALVLVPTRELAAQVGEVLEPLAAASRPARGHRLRRSRPPRPGQEGRPLAPAGGDPGSPRGSRQRARCSRWAPSRSWCWTRPTGCSTWASSRRSTGSCDGCRRIARRCSSRPRSTARWARLARSYTTDPAHHEANPDDETVQEVDHRFVQVTPRDQGADADRHAEGGRPPLAGVRAHPARRRSSAGQAARARRVRPWRCTAT